LPRPLPDFGLWTLDFGLAAASHHRLIPMVRKFADRGCIGLAVRKHPISRSNIHPLRGTHLPDFGRWTSDFGLAAASHRRLIPMVRKTPELGSHRGDEVDCLAPPLARLWPLDFGLWTGGCIAPPSDSNGTEIHGARLCRSSDQPQQRPAGTRVWFGVPPSSAVVSESAGKTPSGTRNTQYSSRLDCQRATGRHSSWPTLNFKPETSNWLWLGPAS
jgi:hypothetical protein